MTLLSLSSMPTFVFMAVNKADIQEMSSQLLTRSSLSREDVRVIHGIDAGLGPRRNSRFVRNNTYNYDERIVLYTHLVNPIVVNTTDIIKPGRHILVAIRTKLVCADGRAQCWMEIDQPSGGHKRFIFGAENGTIPPAAIAGFL